MITMYLSPRSLEAARAVDPYVSPAAVHAAVEIAVAEQLRASRTEVPTRSVPGPPRSSAGKATAPERGIAAAPGERDPVQIDHVDAALQSTQVTPAAEIPVVGAVVGAGDGVAAPGGVRVPASRCGPRPRCRSRGRCRGRRSRTSPGSTCTAIPSTGVSSAGVAGRDRDEPDVAARHPAELGDQPVEVPPAVEHDVPGDGVDEPADRGRVGQRPGGQHPARHAGEERLLAGDAVEVTAPRGPDAAGRRRARRSRPTICGPAGRSTPERTSCSGRRRHTGTPPTASVISTKPARLISA